MKFFTLQLRDSYRVYQLAGAFISGLISRFASVLLPKRIKEACLLFLIVTATSFAATSQTITITGTPQMAANVSPGFRNRVLYIFKVEVAGSAATLSGVNGVTSSGNYLTSDITPGSGNRGFRLWYYSNAGAGGTASFINGINNLDNMKQDGSVRFTIAGNSTGTGQPISTTFGSALSLPVGIHWLLLTGDIAPTATLGRTIGVNSFNQSAFQFMGTPTIAPANYPATGLQTFRNATLSFSAATPVAASVERGINHLQLYRVDVTANGAATQAGDGNGSASLSFTLGGTGFNGGTTNFNNYRTIYSLDNIFDATDQQLGNAISIGTVANVGDLPLGIPEGGTRSIFLTTHTQPSATIGSSVRVISVNANAPSGTTFVAGSAPANLPAGGLQTVGSNVANVLLTGFKTTVPTLLQGTTNNLLGGVAVSVTGGTTVMSRLSMNVPGTFSSTDYTAIKLWASDNSTFDPANSVLLRTWGTTVSPNNQLTFDFPGISQVPSTVKHYAYFTAGTTRYYFLSVDIAPGASVGRQIGLSFNATNSNTSNTIIPGNRTVVTPTDPSPSIGVNPQVNISSPIASALNLPRGAANQVLYRLKFSVSNTNTLLNSIAYKVNTTNYNDIEGSYKLYYSNSTSFNQSTATQIGAVPASANAQTLNFSAIPAINLTPGVDGYLYLVANTNAAATLGNTVVIDAPVAADISLSSGIKTVTANKVTHTISGPPQVNLTTAALPSENIGRGTKNVVLYQINMQASVADAEFSGITMKTAPAGFGNGDVTVYRLYYSTDAIFDLDKDLQIGTSVSGAGTDQNLTFTLSSPIRLELGVTSTLFLVADIATGATPGNVISIAAQANSSVFFILGEAIGMAGVGTNKTIVAAPIVTISSPAPQTMVVAAGSRDVLVYAAKLIVEPSAYVNLTGVSIAAKNSFEPTDVSGGFRFYLSTDDILNTSTDKLIGSATLSTTPQMLVVNVLRSIRLNAGSTQYLLIATDISPYAQTGKQVQLDPLSLTNLLFESSSNTGATQPGNALVIGAAVTQSFPFPTPGSSVMPCVAPNTPTSIPGKVLNITMAPYNADPTGVQDATAAFRLAVSQNSSFVYVPNGTYRFSDSVGWRPENSGTNGFGGANIQMWGESREGVILKLDNNAIGYGNPAKPKSFLNTGTDNPERFNNSLHNLTIEVGSGNPGAIGIRHYCNNLGGMYNITVRSVDGGGIAGIDKAYSRANGPSFLKDIIVDGFDVGIQTDFSVESETMEHITLMNQKKFGFYNYKQVVSLRDLKVINCGGPAFVNESGHISLIDAVLGGTGPAAIQNGTFGKMLIRNLKTTGYTNAISDPEKPVLETSVAEYTADPVVGRNGTTIGSTLKLPVKETPVIPWDAPSTWVNVEDFGATTDGRCDVTVVCLPCDDDGPKIQLAIDATLPGGSRAGATTLFLPGNYRLHSTVRIRGSIRRIISTGKLTASPYSGINPNGLPSPVHFIVENGTYPEIEIQNLATGSSTTNGCAGCLGVTQFENNSGRTLIFKNSGMGSCVFNGGEVFFESVSFQRDALLTFNNAKVWARQLNPERDAAKIIVNGGTFWCLGLKTEGHGEIIIAKNKARVELFGGFVYSLSNSRNEPMFRLEDAEASLNFYEYNGRYGNAYLKLVEDVKDGTTVTLERGADAPSYPAAQPPQVPAYPARWSQRNDFTIADRDNVVGSNVTLYVNNGTYNKAPSFTLSNPNVEVLENLGSAIIIDPQALDINDGNPETDQILSFVISTDNDALFTTLPTIDAITGKLTFAIKPYTTGTAVVTVTLKDDGSNVAPNQNTSVARTFVITVAPLPVPVITAASSLTFCPGGSVVLTSTEASAYQWFKTGTLLTGETNRNLTASLTGDYTVEVTYANGVKKTSLPTSVNAADITRPEVRTKNISITLDANGNVSIIPAMIDNGSTDNCSIASITLDKLDFNCSNVGPNTVTLTVTDVNNNTESKSAVVTVMDNIKPTVKTKNITVNLDATGNAGITPAMINDGSTDNCPIASVTLDKTAFNCNNTGDNIVTLTVTDVNNNSDTKTATVTVVDNIKPTVITKPVTLYLDASGNANVTAAQVNNGSSDNCGVASMSLDITYFNCSNVGQNNVMLTVVDTKGNSESKTAVVTVVDNSRPTVITRNLTVYLVRGSAQIMPADVDNGSTDNCSIASLELNKTTFSCSDIGNQTVTLKAIDQSGNTSSATATVTVIGSIPTPAITVSRTDNTYTGLGANTIALGYGAQSLTLTASNNGSASSTYSWSPATGLSNTTSASPVFTPTTAGTYMFTVKVMNEFGCEASTTVTIVVIDVRCGNKNDKVLVCKKEGTNKANEICISASAVANHLNKGDKLGSCQGSGNPAPVVGKSGTSELQLAKVSKDVKFKFYPNPFASQTTVSFTLSYAEQKVTVAIFDELGKRITTIYTGPAEANVSKTIVFNGAQLSSGSYYARLITATGSETIKLIVSK